MTDLSASAQAVLDAFLNGYICNPRHNVAFESDRNGLAAALRAAATAIGVQEMFHPDSKRTEGVKWCVQNIYTIAAELEALND